MYCFFVKVIPNKRIPKLKAIAVRPKLNKMAKL